MRLYVISYDEWRAVRRNAAVQDAAMYTDDPGPRPDITFYATQSYRYVFWVRRYGRFIAEFGGLVRSQGWAAYPAALRAALWELDGELAKKGFAYMILSCYGVKLREYYIRLQFSVYQTEAFKAEYAPDGWDVHKLGRPAVFYMWRPLGQPEVQPPTKPGLWATIKACWGRGMTPNQHLSPYPGKPLY